MQFAFIICWWASIGYNTGPLFVLFGPGGRTHDERLRRFPNYYKRSKYWYCPYEK